MTADGGREKGVVIVWRRFPSALSDLVVGTDRPSPETASSPSSSVELPPLSSCRSLFPPPRNGCGESAGSSKLESVEENPVYRASAWLNLGKVASVGVGPIARCGATKGLIAGDLREGGEGLGLSRPTPCPSRSTLSVKGRGRGWSRRNLAKGSSASAPLLPPLLVRFLDLLVPFHLLITSSPGPSDTPKLAHGRTRSLTRLLHLLLFPPKPRLFPFVLLLLCDCSSLDPLQDSRVIPRTSRSPCLPRKLPFSKSIRLFLLLNASKQPLVMPPAPSHKLQPTPATLPQSSPPSSSSATSSGSDDDEAAALTRSAGGGSVSVGSVKGGDTMDVPHPMLQPWLGASSRYAISSFPHLALNGADLSRRMSLAWVSYSFFPLITVPATGSRGGGSEEGRSIQLLRSRPAGKLRHLDAPLSRRRNESSRQQGCYGRHPVCCVGDRCCD